MKKLLPFLAISVSSFGMPIGNPASPTILEQGFFIPDTVWCQPRVSYLFDHTQVKFQNHTHRTSNAQLGALTWSIRERFDLSCVLGGNFIWYGEGKLILLEIKDAIFAIFGEAGGEDSSDVKMRFWEAGAAFTQRLGYFSPYLGIAAQQSRWKIEHVRLEQKHSLGPFLGCTLSNSKKISANVEWRGVIENSFTVSSEVRF